jgi:hypothetical protein
LLHRTCTFSHMVHFLSHMLYICIKVGEEC